MYSKLLQWKTDPYRKPLILRGARQTGKTYLLTEFGRKEFSNFHYLNFQSDRNISDLFNESLDPVYITGLIEFYLGSSINIREDLIFLDEIQECSRALTSLKFFCEKMPEMAVVCAGSLLGVVHSDSAFPVGKVSFMDLYPMSFEEFLLASGEESSLNYLSALGGDNLTIPEIVHKHLLGLLKDYMVVGGMPEVVSAYIRTLDKKQKIEAFGQARLIQSEILTAYMGDFSKYSGKTNSNDIVSVFESIPSQLAKENKKFIPSKVFQGGRFSRLKSSVDWLVGAGLAIRVKIANSGETPLSAFTKDNYFKLYFFDTGLLGSLGGLDPGSVYLENNLFATFRGAFCENLVAQEFLSSGSGTLYGWAGNTSEVEFIRDIRGKVYPVEVKAGLSGKLKSLNVFYSKYKPPYRTRISSRNLEINTDAGMHSYPLYLAGRFPLI